MTLILLMTSNLHFLSFILNLCCGMYSLGGIWDEFGVESLRSKIGLVKITKVQVERIKIH